MTPDDMQAFVKDAAEVEKFRGFMRAHQWELPAFKKALALLADREAQLAEVTRKAEAVFAAEHARMIAIRRFDDENTRLQSRLTQAEATLARVRALATRLETDWTLATSHNMQQWMATELRALVVGEEEPRE